MSVCNRFFNCCHYSIFCNRRFFISIQVFQYSMDIRIVAAAREPEWFSAHTFCQEVLNFSFRQLGEISPETERSLYRLTLDFRRAVVTVGKAVFTLQVSFSNKLRSIFIDSVNIIAGVVDFPRENDIIEFMRQAYLHHDVFNTIFSLLAIIGELILFLRKFGFHASDELLYRPWCIIYEYRLRDELLSVGGFEKLLDAAKVRFIDNDLYKETLSYFENRNRNPNAVVHGGDNFPDNLLQLLNQRNVAPGDINLAMRILRQLYDEHGIVPPNPPEN